MIPGGNKRDPSRVASGMIYEFSGGLGMVLLRFRLLNLVMQAHQEFDLYAIFIIIDHEVKIFGPSSDVISTL